MKKSFGLWRKGRVGREGRGGIGDKVGKSDLKRKGKNLAVGLR
jgi:hypothetical protein